MKIGVLQTGLVPDGFAAAHGEYDAIFERLLRKADPSVEVEGWRVIDDRLPKTPFDADGWIISGSKHGVYEDHSWIEPLKVFIRGCAEARAPMIGVCFGHQIMAEALGGRAEKYAGGWRLGPQDYRLLTRPAWMAEAPERIRLHALHQDQVTVRPPDAISLAEGEDCAFAALAYGPPEAPYAISIQPHPEFSDDYARELIEVRRGAPFPAQRSAEALDRLAAERAVSADWSDADWAARWFIGFLRSTAPKERA